MIAGEGLSIQAPVRFVTNETTHNRPIHPPQSLKTKEVAASSGGQGSVRQVQSEGGFWSKEVPSSQVKRVGDVADTYHVYLRQSRNISRFKRASHAARSVRANHAANSKSY